MFFEKHETADSYKIWLSQDEVEQLLDETSDSMHRLALELGVRCGLRTEEIINVAPAHVRDTAAGLMVRIDSAKTSGKRQVPIPQEMAIRIDSIDNIRPEPSHEPLIGSSKRTLRRWIDKTSARLADRTGDDMWEQLSMHDLRRTWATSLKGEDVDAMIVCDWGGWSSLETFLEHYRGKFAPEAQRKQREKVEWLK